MTSAMKTPACPALPEVTTLAANADHRPARPTFLPWSATAVLSACLKTRPVRAPGLQAPGLAAKSWRPRARTRRSARVLKHALTLVTATLALVLTGCVPFVAAIPSIRRPVIEGKRFSSEEVAFVRLGVTTRQDITRTLGQPWAYYEDSQVMVYYGEQRVGFWAAGLVPLAPAPALVGDGEITRLHYLFVKLDPRDRVERLGFVKATHRTKTRDVVKKWEAERASNSEKGNGDDKSVSRITVSAK